MLERQYHQVRVTINCLFLSSCLTSKRMMGLPEGYVEKPICELFGELAENAFLLPENSGEGKTYRDFLPKELWHFRKKCQFKFKTNTELPYFQLALSSPLEGRTQLPFYLESEYSKHLIGNGWCK